MDSQSAESSIFISKSKSYREIAVQAQNEMDWLKEYDVFGGEDQKAVNILRQNGYKKWLIDCQEYEDRIRLIGFLSLIVGFSKEMSEE